MTQEAIDERNADTDEVEKFGRLSARWWDESGPLATLHTINPLRTDYIAGLVELDGARVLDVGCGGGILSEAMARKGAEVHGIDVVERNIHIASMHAAQAGLDIRYEQLTAESLADSGAQYDVVLNMEVVEHVADLDLFMEACNRLVRPGGLMFVATINRTLLALLIAIVGAEYVLRWMPKGTHRWRWFRRPAQIRILLQAGGLHIGRLTGVAVDPFRKRLFLTPMKQVNYMLSAVKEPAREAPGKA